MRKLTYAIVALCLSTTGLLSAKPVSVNSAQQAATNFYTQQYGTAVPANISFAYTETTSAGDAAYYIFNVNTNGGFIIISADDAARPIIAYSNSGQFVMPAAGNNVDYWMEHCKKEIAYIKAKNIQATAAIKTEWTNYINNVVPQNYDKKKFTSVSPLTSITWDQQEPPYPYNYFCPPKTTGSTSRSQSVTGCVATTMSQMMRYWSYPAHGLYTHTFDENTGAPFEYSDNYGVFSRNFAADNYDWANMPMSPTSTKTVSTADSEIARVMFDAGVSVDMDWDPSGSGAEVIEGDDSVSAEGSYVKFFGYDKYTIQGLYEANYSYATWQGIIENELNNGRLVEYCGFGPAGGHTWLCEGWTAGTDTTFYMNWGWSGQDNGNFTLNNLNPGGDVFDTDMEAVIGVQPAQARAHFVAGQTSVCLGSSVSFTDQSLSYPGTTVTGWLWSFGDGGTSTMQNPTYTYAAAGTYSVTEVITTSTSAGDTMTRNAYVQVNPATGIALPMMQTFEGGTFPPAGWYLNNPNDWTTSGYSYGSIWHTTATAGGYGKSGHSMMFNNFGGLSYNPTGGQHQQIYTPGYNFTNITSTQLYFDVSYEPLNGEYSDTLDIYYSLDCGTTFTQIYSKGGMALATTGDSLLSSAIGVFVPTNTQWRTDTITLPAAVYGQANVLFSFENRSFSGDAMYIDNINIPLGPASVQNIQNNSSVSLYPNPNNGSFTIDMSDMAAGKSYIKVYNALGQQVYNAELNASTTQINLTDKATGIYMYRITTETGKTISTGKLEVQ